jgi:5-formyltetrahydrofolate cyclo-ligase
VSKEALRREIRHLKQQYTPAQLEQMSLPVIDRLRPLLSGAQTVMAYYSLPDEVNTHQLIDELVAEGKTVLLPKVLDDTTMELRRYTGPHDLAPGPFGIMEPIGPQYSHSSLLTPHSSKTIDVALIPGVAFDALGHRLGRGRGYYDRFLRTMGTVPSVSSAANYRGTVPSVRPHFIGLCFDFQRVPAVPVDPTDIPVDQVISS